MNRPATLWTTEDRSRWFLMPDDAAVAPGTVPIRTLTGRSALANGEMLAAFEVTEDQARRWVKDLLGQTLTELKHGLNEKIGDWRTSLEAFNHRPVADDTTITPEAPAAILDLFRQLPGIVGQSVSGDESRVGAARNTMRELQQRLKDAGIDVGDRMTDFPDRLATLRQTSHKPHEG